MVRKFKKYYSDINLKRLISNFVVDFKNFTFKLAVYRLCCNLPVIRAKIPKINIYFEKQLQRVIKEILFEICSPVLKEFNEKNTIIKKNTICDEKNVWVFWWQGEENAPLLVKNCITSIRNNSGSDQVYVLSEYNYKKFIEIPIYIIEKFRRGEIGTAHFSDILRMMLLCKHGGIWIDATVFCSRKIPDKFFSYSFFTCRNSKEISYNSTRFSWTPFIMGSPKDSPITELILNSLLIYWKKKNLAIDYLFLDIILELIYENVPIIKERIDSIPCNNELVLAMLNEMKANMPFSKEKLEGWLRSNTYLFKLSWKFKFKEVLEDGQKTLYHHYLNHFDDFQLIMNE